MSEERFIDLESRIAHQDHLLQELNDIVTKQQEKIMQLETRCDAIIDRVRSIGEAVEELPGHEIPPHY